MIQGLAALLKHTVYVLPNSGLLVSTSYTTWGWLLIIWGMIMAVAAHGLLSGSGAARWFSVFLVVVNLLGTVRVVPGVSAVEPDHHRAGCRGAVRTDRALGRGAGEVGQLARARVDRRPLRFARGRRAPGGRTDAAVTGLRAARTDRRGDTPSDRVRRHGQPPQNARDRVGRLHRVRGHSDRHRAALVAHEVRRAGARGRVARTRHDARRRRPRPRQRTRPRRRRRHRRSTPAGFPRRAPSRRSARP